jgi:signal transduction histidine kinase/ligand-binding sensor domain-containing protein/DNA-binding response OmpR family regulator
MKTPISLWRLVAILALMGWQGGEVFGQAIVRFQRFSTDKGLSQEYIFCMVQDQKGFMWFGTEYGLNRFDGYSFKIYLNNPDDTTSLSYNTVRSILEDTYGNIWAGTLTGELNKLDPKTETFTRYYVDEANAVPPNHKTITAIAEDNQGGLWAGTSRSGLFYKPIESNHFIPVEIPVRGDGISRQPFVYAITFDRTGKMWVGTAKGLFSYDYSSKIFTPFLHDPDDPASVRNNSIRALKNSASGKLWVGTSAGVDWYDTQSQRFFHLGAGANAACSLEGIVTIDILEDNDNNLWITSSQGLLKYDLSTQCYQRFANVPSDLNSLSNDHLYGLLLDNQGGVWIGTRDGANRYDAKLHKFRNHNHEPGNPRSLPNSHVWFFEQDNEGVLWIGTNAGYFPYDLNKGVIPESELPPVIAAHVVRPNRTFLLEDQQGNIWASERAADGNGVFVINRSTGKVRHYTNIPSDAKSIGSNHVWRGYESSDGLVWLKTQAGMSIYFPEQDSFKNYTDILPDGTPFRAQGVTDFYEDNQGKMWLGLRGEGLLFFDHAANIFQYYQNDPSNPNSLSDNVVHVIHQDHQGRMWISTPSGLNLMTDKEKGVFRRMREKEGLPNDFVFGITEDSRKRLWMSTNGGIVCFDPITEKFRVYTEEDGLANKGYYDDSYFMDPKTGEMFFGSSRGFSVFHPDSIRDDSIVPPVFITRFQYLTHDKKGVRMIEEPGITERTSMTLSHRYKALLQFEFAALSFSKPTKNQYAYQLEGYYNDWIPLETKREVSFTNLPPGKYTLRVKGSNGDGYWNETPAELKITILPPWYWAWYSKSLYLLLLAGLLYAFYRFQLNRQLAQAETQRLRELDEVKNRIYANITHQFRTPLTLILGMADQIEEAPGRWLKDGVRTIRDNGNNLLRLVRQMLDLSRLQAGKLPLRLGQGDVIPFLRLLMELYRSSAEAKGIALRFQAEVEELVMDYDPDKLADIVSNLLSNALKFTPAGGAVTVCCGRYGAGSSLEGPPAAPGLLLTVQDTGPGIPPAQLPHIFDRFYQGDDQAMRRGEGTGIGLALAAELAKLLGGTIAAQSEPGQGAVFSLRLPIHHAAPLLEALPTLGPDVAERSPALKPAARKTAGKRPLALIVEDNPEVSAYLVACLQDQYRLETAANGQLGVERAIELVPDLIISDVMMPVMDGFELCRTLKEDLRTSHIPIVLLTARADIDSRLEGLEMGADAYLAKPFNQRELEVSLRKSLELRERLRERYAGKWPPSPAPSGAFRQEDAFLQKLRGLVEEQDGSEALSVQELAEQLSMTEKQLRSKTKALLGLLPKDILLNYRLEKAYALLQQGELNVSEVAYRTGFTDVAHLSNAFFKAYGVRPSEVRGG